MTDEQQSKDLTIPVAKNALTQFFDQRRGPLENLLTAGITPEQFLTTIISEGNKLNMSLSDQEMNDKRTQISFLVAASNAAIIGLLPGEVQGHCYLVPSERFRNKPNQHTLISLWIGYKGFLELAFASDFLAQCDPELHLDREVLPRWHDDRPRIHHDIPNDRPLPDRTNIVGAYCTYMTKSGGFGHCYVSRAELAKVDTGYNAWKSNYPAMCLKTPIRRCSNRWRLNQRMATAIKLDEQAERNEPQINYAPKRPEDEVPTIDLDKLPEPEGDD